MAKEILLTNGVNDANVSMAEIENFRLSNIKPIRQGETENRENILTLKIPFSIELLMADGNRITIKQDELKLKNYGDFYRFIFDRRIKGLLPYVKGAKVIDRTVLEEELDNYDLLRPEIFKIVHSFEKSIIRRHQELLDPNNEAYYYKDRANKKGLSGSILIP